MIDLAGDPAPPETWATPSQRSLLGRLKHECMILRLGPDDARQRAKVAELWLLAGHPQGALQVLGSGLARAPDQPQLVLLAARAQHALQRAHSAQALYARHLELAPSSPDSAHARALLLERLGREAEVEELLADCLARAPNHAGLTALAGRRAYDSGDHARAETLLRRSLERAPEALETHFVLAASLREQGRDQDALVHEAIHRRLVRLDDLGLPSEYPSWMRSLELGAAWLQDGEPALAREELREVLATRYEERAAALYVRALNELGIEVEAELAHLRARHAHLAEHLHAPPGD